MTYTSTQSLIVTIIVMLILAGISLSMLAGDNSVLNRATDAKRQTEIATKKEEVQMAINAVLIDNYSSTNNVTIPKVIQEVKKNYSSQAEKDAITGETTGEDEEKFPGTITYAPPASTIGENIIIEVDEYLNIVGATSGAGSSKSTSDYVKVGNIYCNSPELSGFNPNCTYYVTYKADGTVESESTKISQTAPDGWYDYSSNTKKWANIMTNNNGNKTYWVWIPRFKYTVDSTNKKTNIKFVTKDDKYYEDVSEEKMVDRTSTLDSSYKLSDAFTFNGKPLSGYWVSKYRVQEGTNDGTGDKSISNIQVDLSGFNKTCTYYVTYNLDGSVKDESKLISEKAPNDWYDYSKKQWANIVTKGTDNSGNELKTYWTYIPRYEYQTWQYLQKTNVKFITTATTDANVDKGFKISDSFTFAGKDLKGYWVSKYRVQNGTANATEFNGTYYK